MRNNILSKLLTKSFLQLIVTIIFLSATIIKVTISSFETHFIQNQEIILDSIKENVLLSHMNNMEEVLLYYSRDPELPDVFNNKEVADRFSRDWYITRLIQPSRAWIYYGSRDNQILVSPSWHPDNNYNLTNRPWYTSAININGIAWSEPYTEYVTKNTVLTASIAIRDGVGNILGVFAIDTFVNEFLELMELNSHHFSIPVFISDLDGNLLAGNNNKDFETLSRESESLKKIFQKDKSSYLSNQNDKKYLISYTILKDVGLVLFSAMNKDLIWTEAAPLIRQLILGTIIGILAAIILSVITSRHISGNIFKLNKYMDKIKNDSVNLQICVSGRDEIFQLNSKINQVFDNLRKEKETVNSLISLLSHNISNRIMTINRKAYQILSSIEDSEEKKIEHVQGIYNSTNSINMLVKGFLIANTIKNNPINMLYNDVLDCLELIEIAVARKSDILNFKEQKVSIVIKAEKENSLVKSNENFLLEILDNLIDNASKYSDKGSDIDIYISREDQWILFQVADHGPGFPKDEKERIFKPHANISIKPTNGEYSNGVGLSISYEVAKQMGCILKLSELIGYGAVLELRIPSYN